ncbi:A33 protein, partial [Polypterus senegalus]
MLWSYESQGIGGLVTSLQFAGYMYFLAGSLILSYLGYLIYSRVEENVGDQIGSCEDQEEKEGQKSKLTLDSEETPTEEAKKDLDGYSEEKNEENENDKIKKRRNRKNKKRRNSIQEEREASEKVLNELICAIERTRAEIYRSAETKWKLIENQTECLLNLIEQEITELKSKSVQFEKILETDDPIHSLQAADVTLDPDTASPWLILSEDGKAVRYANERQHLPDSPLRFDPVISVLGLKSFHSGKHYWEVDTGDKTDWDLGVAKESVRRKGMLMLSPQNGYWTLCLREGSHVRACGNPTVNLSMNTKPRKVGIFLDYDGGFLSFYDVSSRGHLYTFFDTFTEKLYPYFNPFITYEDKNDHPLKICSFSAVTLQCTVLVHRDLGGFGAEFNSSSSSLRYGGQIFSSMFQRNLRSSINIGVPNLSLAPEQSSDEEKKKLLLKTHAEIQKTVADQQNKLELLRKEVESIKNAAQKEIMESGKMLDELICIIEQTRVQIIGMIERKQQSDVKQVTDKIGQLTLDIQELEKRNGDIEQLLKTEDHIRFLQCKTNYLLSHHSFSTTVDITLDLKTAHQKLILSSNRKEVRFGGRRLSLRDSPLQFDPVVAVLGSESFTSGKHYWEVDVGDKTDWNLGVASESINRKGNVKLNPDNGYWTIWLRNGNEFEALSSPSMALPLSLKPQKVGVFLDYDEGQLSFYNLELRCHLYTFNANFTEKLYPYFCPFIVYDGKNSAPLIISN